MSVCLFTLTWELVHVSPPKFHGSSRDVFRYKNRGKQECIGAGIGKDLASLAGFSRVACSQQIVVIDA